jgi:nucleotide-binding universal stress UspA family protein
VAENEGAGRIVVGVDGSENSYRALKWAFKEARLRAVGLRLIHAFNFDAVVGKFPVSLSTEQIEKDAQAFLDRVLTHVREADAGIDIDGVLVPGSAARALVEGSRDAELLVIGSRGLGGIAGALLGSVSVACVHHAACPILVVPPPDRLEHAQAPSGEAAERPPHWFTDQPG